MFQLQAPPGMTSASVGDVDYTPDERGLVTVVDEGDLRSLKALGFTVPGVAAKTITIIEDEHGNADLITKNNVLTAKNADLTLQVNALNDENSKFQLVEEELRRRNQELEGQVLKLTDDLAEARKGTTEGSETAGSASDSSEGSGEAPVAPESPIKPVDGVTISSPEGFDDLEYNALKEWLKVHGVHAPANIKKAAAVAACKERFAELTKPE